MVFNVSQFGSHGILPPPAAVQLHTLVNIKLRKTAKTGAELLRRFAMNIFREKQHQTLGVNAGGSSKALPAEGSLFFSFFWLFYTF